MPLEEGQDIAPYDPREIRPEPVTLEDLRDEEGNPLPSFDKRHAEAFDGLVFLGALTETFTWLGHEFCVRTLTQDEILSIPILMRPWQGTVGEPKAYSTAVVALATISVDGKTLPSPIGESKDPLDWARQRFHYVKANWFEYTIDRVYNQWLELDGKTKEVLAAMEKAYGSEGSTSGSSVDSDEPNDKDS